MDERDGTETVDRAPPAVVAAVLLALLLIVATGSMAVAWALSPLTVAFGLGA